MDYFIKMITSYSNPESITEESTVPEELINYLKELANLPNPDL